MNSLSVHILSTKCFILLFVAYPLEGPPDIDARGNTPIFPEHYPPPPPPPSSTQTQMTIFLQKDPAYDNLAILKGPPPTIVSFVLIWTPIYNVFLFFFYPTYNDFQEDPTYNDFYLLKKLRPLPIILMTLYTFFH